VGDQKSYSTRSKPKPVFFILQWLADVRPRAPTEKLNSDRATQNNNMDGTEKLLDLKRSEEPTPGIK
jgi:hypothetical protein